MKFFYQNNVVLDSLIFVLLLCGILIFFLLPPLLFGTRSTYFACTRSVESIDCSINRSALFFKNAEIKIHDPIAVDVDEVDRKDIFGNPSSRRDYISSATVRTKDVADKINLYSGYDHQAVRSIAKEINEFLLFSQASELHMKF